MSTPVKMTAKQLRAHQVIHDQTLWAAWHARCVLQDEGRALLFECMRIKDEARLARGGSYKYFPSPEADALYKAGQRITRRGGDLWIAAARAEFGRSCTMTWEGGVCTLSNGEVYTAI